MSATEISAKVQRHALTAADRRRGALAAAETRRRRRQPSAPELARRVIAEDPQRVIGPLLEAIDRGEWQAAEALLLVAREPG